MMKVVAILACLLVGTAVASPVNEYFTFPPPYYTDLDIWGLLESLLGHEGYDTAAKLVDLAHQMQTVISHIKDKVPEVYKEIHDLAGEIQVELEEILTELKGVFQKKPAAYGFDWLDSLSELTGGTQLSTVMRILSLAEKTHKLVTDVKETVPHLEEAITRIENKLTESMTSLAHHVLKELSGSDDPVARSVTSFLQDLLNRAKHAIHDKLLNFLQAVDDFIFKVEDLLPDIYAKLQGTFDEIRKDMKEILKEIDEVLVGYSFLDTLQDFTSGTRMSTVFKVINLLDKINTVVQDIRGFGPRAEILLEHSVTRIASTAQDFLTHSYQVMVVS